MIPILKSMYNFKYKPYEHQLEALEKAGQDPYFAFFMDMGTGKSKVLIDNMAILYDSGLVTGALIVAPKGVFKNWERKELPTHLPDHIKANIVAWSPQKTKKKLKEIDSLYTRDKLQIFVMNVEAFSTKRGVAVARNFIDCHHTLIAVDESTTIKARTANRTKNLIKLADRCAYRRILTGSPVTKSPLDLYTQCEFLCNGVLKQSNFWTFQNRYAKLVRTTMGAHSFNKIVGYQNLDELNKLIEPFSFRVRKEDCLDLPDKVYIKRSVELTKEQAKLYDQMKRNALAIIEGEGIIDASTILTQLLRLQQVCSGFGKLDDGRVVKVPSNKITELMSVVQETDGKIIIWGNFTHDLHIIGEEIAKVYGEKSVALFYGETPAEERQDIVESFQDPNSDLRFFVGQPRTGGYGLTLTQAHTVIYYSNGYDLEVRLQSEDRAHRIGQTNKVVYVDLVTEKTVDEKVLQALRNKIDISTTVMAEGHKKWII